MTTTLLLKNVGAIEKVRKSNTPGTIDILGDGRSIRSTLGLLWR